MLQCKTYEPFCLFNKQDHVSHIFFSTCVTLWHWIIINNNIICSSNRVQASTKYLFIFDNVSIDKWFKFSLPIIYIVLSRLYKKKGNLSNCHLKYWSKRSSSNFSLHAVRSKKTSLPELVNSVLCCVAKLAPTYRTYHVGTF